MESRPRQADCQGDAAARRATLGRVAGAVALLVTLALAGCLGSKAEGLGTGTATQPPTTAPLSAPPANLTLPPAVGNATLPPPGPASPPLEQSLGEVGRDRPVRATGRCPCPHELRFNLTLEKPATPQTWLELRVTWDGTRSPGTKPHLLPPNSNTTLPPERAGNATIPAERGFDDWRIQSFAPEGGRYRLALNGTGDYVLTIRLLSLDWPHGTSADALPNLVTLLPIDIRYGACDRVEQQEQGAKRCLRLANGVANLGDGPLEVHLAYDRALFALAPALVEGRFIQRIYAHDGSHRERETGPATFHLSHSHWHFASLARFSLHSYDPATGLRGEEVTAHHKQGFCFLDWDKLESPDSDPGAPSNAEQDCIIPTLEGWSMGISRGYYDYYWAALTDQYVDVAGVPDGIYELVSTADGQRSLEELDPTDNSASVVVRLQDGRAEVLEERAHYRPKEYRETR